MSLIPHIRPIVFAAVAGFAGGALASRVFRIDPVHAQDTKAVPQLVQAKEFILLDEFGRPRGEWRLDSSGEPLLQLLDQAGHPICEAEKMKMRPLSR